MAGLGTPKGPQISSYMPLVPSVTLGSGTGVYSLAGTKKRHKESLDSSLKTHGCGGPSGVCGQTCTR
jgi:hypothetical protein